MIVIQESFKGGMNQLSDPTRISRTEYLLLINGRTRESDNVAPINGPLKLNSQLPIAGKMQGVYGVGSLLIIFCDGKCAVRDLNDTNGTFLKLEGFQMDRFIERIYAQPVPASTINRTRAAVSATNAKAGIALVDPIVGSPAVLLVQDGINQSRVIFQNGSSRTTYNYDLWSMTNREYVPIGTQMIFHGSKLYILAPNGVDIYQSVSGRPLDFMINVDTNGNKLPNEVDGGAATVAHRVTFSPLSTIASLYDPSNGFYASTKDASYLVQPDENSQIFGEPTFINVPLFATGANNNDSVVDLLGDFAFIDSFGLRSFNATKQFRVEGRNSPFSKSVSKFFKGIIQSTTAATTFDNYALFAVNTVYGFGVLVYDTITELFVALDIYSSLNGGAIKQFAEIKMEDGTRRLFFITNTDELYEAFAGPTETVQLYLGEWCSGDPSVEQKLVSLDLILNNAEESGIVYATPFVDRLKGTTISEQIEANYITPANPITLPFGPSSKDTVQTKSFDWDNGLMGWKTGVLISWSFKASLSNAGAEFYQVQNLHSDEEEAVSMKRAKELFS